MVFWSIFRRFIIDLITRSAHNRALVRRSVFAVLSQDEMCWETGSVECVATVFNHHVSCCHFGINFMLPLEIFTQPWSVKYRRHRNVFHIVVESKKIKFRNVLMKHWLKIDFAIYFYNSQVCGNATGLTCLLAYNKLLIIAKRNRHREDQRTTRRVSLSVR